MDFSPGLSYFFGQLGKAFLDPGSHASLFSLVGALFIVVAALGVTTVDELIDLLRKLQANRVRVIEVVLNHALAK